MSQEMLSSALRNKCFTVGAISFLLGGDKSTDRM